jgi:uncharacterized protein YukJ
MALDRYGVLVGTLRGHSRDQPDNQGRWFHVNLLVDAPLGAHRCAVDVDSHLQAAGVQWRVITVAASAIPGAALPTGYHDLARTPSSGALDFHRHPALVQRPGCAFPRQPPTWLREIVERVTGSVGWTAGSNTEAATALESILTPDARIAVFGEPFTTGLGMHNVHQNQGDPAGSQWWAENAIWQDGATVVVRQDGAGLDVFLSKFSTQATKTDDDGHPA